VTTSPEIRHMWACW